MQSAKFVNQTLHFAFRTSHYLVRALGFSSYRGGLFSVRALGFEPRTFRVSVECSTN